jgi:trichohyalin
MANNENSVLVSLQELRRIEQDRVTSEKQAALDRTEAERRAADNARLATEQAETLRRQQEAERLRREEEERLRREREERIAAAEAEQRARVQYELEAAKRRAAEEIQQEVASRKLPWAPVIGGIVFLGLAAAGVGYYFHKKSEDASQAEAKLATMRQELAGLQREEKESKAKFARAESELEAHIRKLETAKVNARDNAKQEEQARLIAKARKEQQRLSEQKEARARALRDRRDRIRKAGRPGSDPIGGIDL